MIMIHVLVRLTNDQSQRQIFDVHKSAFNEFCVLEFKQTTINSILSIKYRIGKLIDADIN